VLPSLQAHFADERGQWTDMVIADLPGDTQVKSVRFQVE
jgi:hypothetical protein